MTSSIVFLNETPYFFLDSDCLNASIKMLLPYIRKLKKKIIIKLEKITHTNEIASNI
jgi:hypothetical protein